MPYLRKAGGRVPHHHPEPDRFVGNLVRAAMQGFRQFAELPGAPARSLIGWLTGAMSRRDLYIPQALDSLEIIKFVLRVLGLTWQNIRAASSYGSIGEPAVGRWRRVSTSSSRWSSEGPAAAWEKILRGLANLREMVIEQVMSFVRTSVVRPPSRGCSRA